MTYEEADKAMDEGKCVRNPDNAPGWIAAKDKKGTIWWRNPVTHSQHAFPISDEEKARTDWEVVEQ